MQGLHFPWMELTILLPLLGALLLQFSVSTDKALKTATIISALTFVCSCAELLDFLATGAYEAYDDLPWIGWLINKQVFVVDELSEFLLPLGSLIYLVTILSTLRTKAPRFSLKYTLISEAIMLGIFSCRSSWILVVLLILSVIPVYLELKQRKRCTRVYTIHMGVFIVLLVVGFWWLQHVDITTSAAIIPGALLTGAALLRSGICPFHLWITDLFEKASFGTAILASTPLIGAYAAMRLVLPIAPSWALQSIAILSLVTAVYAAGMGLVQREARRMFCFILLSQSSLVLVGLELVRPIGLTGALCLWLSVGLSLTGFGIVLRCVEARLSRVSLIVYHGLYRQMPMLATFFLLTGLASIGFPFTAGFVGMELLVEGAVDVYPQVGTLVVITAALNGISILSAYFHIFTGRESHQAVPMNARTSEKIAVWSISVLLLVGGIVPQPLVASRYHAAKVLASDRQSNPLTDDEEVVVEPSEHSELGSEGTKQESHNEH